MTKTNIILHDYHRSSACYRVRVALNIKGLDYQKREVNLVTDGGKQHSPFYRKLNPQALVPTLEIDGLVLTQSLAIMEYLDEAYKRPALLPEDLSARAKVRSMAQIIACDTHPLNNLRVLQYMQQHLHVLGSLQRTWYHYWIEKSFDALEYRLEHDDDRGLCCYGDTPTMADLCLIPQLYNARRYEFPVDEYPILVEIEQHCLGLDVFQSASP
jgi:maleylacetoacetate isomerase